MEKKLTFWISAVFTFALLDSSSVDLMVFETRCLDMVYIPFHKSVWKWSRVSECSDISIAHTEVQLEPPILKSLVTVHKGTPFA